MIPGDSDKLLFYFQGGGACWDEYSTKAQLCTTDASPQSLVGKEMCSVCIWPFFIHIMIAYTIHHTTYNIPGIFDRTNTKNNFKDYTIVHVLYCSGDVHGGNVVRPYTDSAGQVFMRMLCLCVCICLWRHT
ncbi:hypothetical protein EON63_13420 [archaeon]|nr:MAG: hypothetical protein EON63_13420 [archaeon]